MMVLTGLTPFFINAGLKFSPTVPCFDAYGAIGEDPRISDAVPRAQELVMRGEYIGRFFAKYCDTLILGECVPGGTTTALCVLRALGYRANVSSSYVQNPIALKEEVSRVVLARIQSSGIDDPIAIMRCAGDPMMPVAAGIASSFTGNLVLGGGTQMLAITALLKKMGKRLPYVITTVYIKEDPTAKAEQLAREIGTSIIFVDPAFGDLGHAGLARYCIGEVKEGMGAGGAMALAYLLGFTPDEIRQKIFETVSNYA
jgi:uncharacterized protein (TIGR00303 family)